MPELGSVPEWACTHKARGWSAAWPRLVPVGHHRGQRRERQLEERPLQRASRTGGVGDAEGSR